MDFRELQQIHTESFFWYVRKIFRKTNISYPLICTQSSYSEQIIETNFFLHLRIHFSLKFAVFSTQPLICSSESPLTSMTPKSALFKAEI